MKLINVRKAGRSDAMLAQMQDHSLIIVSLEPQRLFSVYVDTVLYDIVSCSVPFHSAERDRNLKSRGVEFFLLINEYHYRATFEVSAVMLCC